jgi:dTDP-4-dehydrorhamnose reductase
VFGELQPRTQAIKRLLESSDVEVEANANDASNIVHVDAIADAIQYCTDKKICHKTYTLVNSPQWTWGDMFEYYRKSHSIQFVGLAQPRQGRSLAAWAWKITKSVGRAIQFIRLYLPVEWDELIREKHARYRAEQEIAEMDARLETGRIKRVSGAMYFYRKAPGNTILGLPDTKNSLQKRR